MNENQSVSGNRLSRNYSNFEFILRRLHSISGIFPIGIFLTFHLSANNAAIKGPDAFNFVIKTLRSLPFLELLEIILIGLPILFHGLYGLFITPSASRANLLNYKKERNFAYFAQRITGIIAFVFIAIHIWQFRLVEDLDYAFIARELKNPWWGAGYFVGITSIVYHFTNGLWNFLISWGITIGKQAQKNSAIFCALLFLVIWGIGMSALFSFVLS